MRKFKSVKKVTWDDLFGFKARKEAWKDAVGYGSYLIEETYHAVNMHLYNFIINMMAKHNKKISSDIINFFLTDVQLHEYYFGFLDDQPIPGRAMSFSTKCDSYNRDYCAIYKNPRGNIIVYAVDDAVFKDDKGNSVTKYYIDINFIDSFSFTKEEKKRLFDPLKDRQTKAEEGLVGIGERDFKALALTYAWNLTMAMQEICLYHFGEASYSKEDRGFRPLVHWRENNSRMKLMEYDRDNIVQLPSEPFLSYKRPYNETGSLSCAIDMYCTKISRAMYNYEQIHMDIPLDWMESTTTRLESKAYDIERFVREINSWFFCNSLYDKYGDCVQDMILCPRRICEIGKSITMEKYEIGNNYAVIYNITKANMKKFINDDRNEDFSGNPLASEDMIYLNLVCIQKDKLNLKDYNDLSEFTVESVYIWIHLWAQIIAVIYQKTGIHLATPDHSMKEYLANRAINYEEAISTSAQKRLVLSKAKSYATDLIWKLQRGSFPNENVAEYADALAERFTKIS